MQVLMHMEELVRATPSIVRGARGDRAVFPAQFFNSTCCGAAPDTAILKGTVVYESEGIAVRAIEEAKQKQWVIQILSLASAY